ncbi:hypothetical protein MJL48_28910, partial [Salmonella enterica subsp. enterica serovar Kentucky]|nr:hypothetical protein [Salmonella enterica subsp. enterica serovar Kentucky]
YWHFALAGTLVYYSTGSFVLGLSAAAIAAIVVLKLADWSAPFSIVDAVDDTGYLTVSLDEIRESMGDVEVDLDEVEAVLKRIQR